MSSTNVTMEVGEIRTFTANWSDGAQNAATAAPPITWVGSGSVIALADLATGGSPITPVVQVTALAAGTVTVTAAPSNAPTVLAQAIVTVYSGDPADGIITVT